MHNRKEEPRQRRIAGVPAGRNISPFDQTYYNNGPVLKCPQIYAGFWGLDYYEDSYYQGLQARLTQFLPDLLNSTFMNVLSQYGAGYGAGSAGALVQAHNLAVTGTNFLDSDIANWIQILIDFGVWPDPSSQYDMACVIFLDDTIQVNDPGFSAGPIVMCEPFGDTAFGYHWYFTTTSGKNLPYAVIPALTDNCLQESCPSDNYCNLHLSQSQQDRITITTSHEVAEMMTDPFPFSGWVPEIGDPCGGQVSSITVGSNTWAVQPILSQTDGGACEASQPNPLPPLGPTQGESVMRAIASTAEFNRLLPLPSITVDPESKSVSCSEVELRHYLNRVTGPLPQAQLPAHLPQLLRQAADHIEGRHHRKKAAKKK